MHVDSRVVYSFAGISVGPNVILQPGLKGSFVTTFAPLAFHHFPNLQFLTSEEFLKRSCAFLASSSLQSPHEAGENSSGVKVKFFFVFFLKGLIGP